MRKPESLYQQVMGPAFALLPAAVQRFHALQGRQVLQGWVEVERPATFAARCLAWCLGAPRDARQGPLRFELQAQAGAEVWTRHFPGKTMQSRLAGAGSHLVERLGATRLVFALDAAPQQLAMRLVRLDFLGVPCPRWLMPRIEAHESGNAGRFHFRVQASLALVGVVAAYRGHLEVPAMETP